MDEGGIIILFYLTLKNIYLNNCVIYKEAYSQFIGPRGLQRDHRQLGTRISPYWLPTVHSGDGQYPLSRPRDRSHGQHDDRKCS